MCLRLCSNRCAVRVSGFTCVSSGVPDGTDAQRRAVQLQVNLGPLLPSSPGGDACDMLVGVPS